MSLLSYIQGRRRGKEAHRIEREAMQDPFLAEALEGYDTVAGDHANAVRRMQEQLKPQPQAKKRNILLWTSIAASVLLFVGIGWYLLIQETPQTTLVSETIPVPVHPDSSREKKSLALNEQTEEQSQPEAARQENTERRNVIPPSPPAMSEQAIVEDDLQVSMDVATDEIIVEEEAEELVMQPIASAKIEAAKSKPVEKEEQANSSLTEALQGKVAGVKARGATARSKTRKIRGKVVDEGGEPLPGTNIMVKGQTTGTVADASGEFVLNVDEDATIVANFIGYEQQEIKADTSRVLIAMHEDVRQLDEVVIVGFGAQKKQSVTGSISTVENDMERENTNVPKPVVGKLAYRKYLEENIVRPAEGECAGVKGKVKIRFNVDARGRPYNMQVQQKLCDAADREAMRLISEGSDWTPGNPAVTVTVEF